VLTEVSVFAILNFSYIKKYIGDRNVSRLPFQLLDSLLENDRGLLVLLPQATFIFFPKGILGAVYPVQDLYHGPAHL
jgi:hypothetical protein